jgi:hypothetical protein
MQFDELKSPRVKVLHITDALNGGILTAIKNLTQHVQKCDHYVLWDSHADTPVPKASELTFNNFRMEGGHFSKIQQIKKTVRLIKPDVIHLHSSLSGLYGRVIPLKPPVCYSAHAFAFERKDISKLRALFFRIVESALQINTHTNILFWPIEEKHIKQLLWKRNTKITDALWINLISKIEKVSYIPADTSKQLLVIGRVAPAKDPEFVVTIQNELTKRNLELKIKWFGARDYAQISQLKANGIEGLLWTSQEEVLREQIVKSKAILITSKWEVGPYTFYESLSLGRNVVARDLESINILGVKCHPTVKEFCDEIESLLENDYAKRSFEAQVKSVLGYYKKTSTQDIEHLYERIFKDGN